MFYIWFWMNDDLHFLSSTFSTEEDKSLQRSIFRLNLYLGGFRHNQKPYTIHYNILLMSYHKWNGKDLDEFCHRQTISHFLFNPDEDSVEAREAYYLEIREFLAGNWCAPKVWIIHRKFHFNSYFCTSFFGMWPFDGAQDKLLRYRFWAGQKPLDKFYLGVFLL